MLERRGAAKNYVPPFNEFVWNNFYSNPKNVNVRHILLFIFLGETNITFFKHGKKLKRCQSAR